MRKKYIYFLTILGGLLWLSPCSAYLEPGNGYILLQALGAGLAGLVAILRIYWQKIKSFFARWNKKNHE